MASAGESASTVLQPFTSCITLTTLVNHRTGDCGGLLSCGACQRCIGRVTNGQGVAKDLPPGGCPRAFQVPCRAPQSLQPPIPPQPPTRPMPPPRPRTPPACSPPSSNPPPTVGTIPGPAAPPAAGRPAPPRPPCGPSSPPSSARGSTPSAMSASAGSTTACCCRILSRQVWPVCVCQGQAAPPGRSGGQAWPLLEPFCCREGLLL